MPIKTKKTKQNKKKTTRKIRLSGRKKNKFKKNNFKNKKAKSTLINTFYRGPPYNAYKKKQKRAK